MISSSFSPVIYFMNLLFENTKNATETMPMAKSKKDPVFTTTIKPSSTKPNANNPNLSLDIPAAPQKLNLCLTTALVIVNNSLMKIKLNSLHTVF
jgi:hypothetical protein